MADDPPDGDPEIRRRAAWLLGMLALVAALFVTLMITFFNTSGGDGDKSDVAEPTGLPSTPTATSAPRSSASPSTGTPSGDTGSPQSDPATTTSGSAPPGARASCPSDDPCVLDSDIGNAITAINAYRTKNGKDAVPGTVSPQAAKCALSNGSDCTGGWAQTQVPATHGRADGEKAVDKIKQLGKLLGDMKSIEVGWAYDPGNKTFYFAIVRNS